MDGPSDLLSVHAPETCCLGYLEYLGREVPNLASNVFNKDARNMKTAVTCHRSSWVQRFVLGNVVVNFACVRIG